LQPAGQTVAVRIPPLSTLCATPPPPLPFPPHTPLLLCTPADENAGASVDGAVRVGKGDPSATLLGGLGAAKGRPAPLGASFFGARPVGQLGVGRVGVGSWAPRLSAPLSSGASGAPLLSVATSSGMPVGRDTSLSFSLPRLPSSAPTSQCPPSSFDSLQVPFPADQSRLLSVVYAVCLFGRPFCWPAGLRAASILARHMFCVILLHSEDRPVPLATIVSGLASVSSPLSATAGRSRPKRSAAAKSPFSGDALPPPPG
jgi:hypothetical protein